MKHFFFYYSRYAKMYQKGVSLTSEGCALIYLVDDAGTRTTSDAMTFDITRDYSIPVFLKYVIITFDTAQE